MKKIQILIILFFITQYIYAQYTPLEVGTSIPEERAVRFATFYDNLLDSKVRYLNFGKNNTTNNCGEISFNFAGDNSLSNFISIGFYGQGVEQRIYLNAAGRMGIGTNNPQSKLDIRGNISLDRNRYIYFGIEGQTGEYINEYPAGTLNIFSGGQLKIKMPNDNMSMSLMPNGGNVGIGTTSPGIYRLNVAGKIRADEIVVNTTGADFVFDPTYKLPTLSELEAYIKTHKHLPDIAPAKEMQENGVSAGEMQTKLLQKVEELTLYLIELKKEIEILKQYQK